MNSKLTINPKGQIEAFYVFDNNTKQTVLKCHNAAMYSSCGIIASALCNKTHSGINAMYMAYYNGTGDPDWPTIDKTMTTDYFKTLTGAYGYIKVPIILAGTASTGTLFGNNIITVHGISMDNASQNPDSGEFSSANQSKVFAVALVSSPDLESTTDDAIFSMANIQVNGANSYIDKLSNAQIGIDCTVKIGEAE